MAWTAGMMLIAGLSAAGLVFLAVGPLVFLGPAALLRSIAAAWPVILLMAAGLFFSSRRLLKARRLRALAAAGEWRELLALIRRPPAPGHAPPVGDGLPGIGFSVRAMFDDPWPGGPGRTELCMASCLIAGDFDEADRIESIMGKARPRWAVRYSPWFALSRELRGRPAEAAGILVPYLATRGGRHDGAARLHCGYSRLLSGRVPEAVDALAPLAKSRDPGISFLASYLLVCCGIPQGDQPGKAEPVDPSPGDPVPVAAGFRTSGAGGTGPDEGRLAGLRRKSWKRYGGPGGRGRRISAIEALGEKPLTAVLAGLAEGADRLFSGSTGAGDEDG